MDFEFVLKVDARQKVSLTTSPAIETKACYSLIISTIYFSSWKILVAYRRADAYREAAGLLSVSFIVLVLTMASTAIKLFQRYVLDRLRINELEKTTLKSEMEKLKNQINPHSAPQISQQVITYIIDNNIYPV